MVDRRSGKPGRLRIIGGQWRGRKLEFTESPGLRPTPDRVRETLFNWLSNDIVGARCLDLFSGSGALGLEALSRGAGHCRFIDSNSRTIDSLRQQLEILGCETAQTLAGDGLQWLRDSNTGAEPFDIIFLDPPFQQKLLVPACQLLEDRGWLADAAHIYLESGTQEATPAVPSSWELKREKKAGEVRYQLFVRAA
jgi:16S rRNA (guanine966-N2)-methyltransferase